MAQDNGISLLEVSKLAVELAMVGGTDNDLDALLGRLHVLLGKMPQFHLQPKGALYMRNARQVPVRVAQLGLEPNWQWDPATDPLLKGPAGPGPDCALERVEVEGRPQHLLVLPLVNAGRPLGQIKLFTEAGWVPSAQEMASIDNLLPALSGIVSRFLLDEVLRVRENELRETRRDAIRRLGTASEYRDHETGYHVMRMTGIAVAIARALGVSAEDRELLSVTAPMHDVGKIGIPDAIMLKPDLLTAGEFETMKTHTDIGGKLLNGADALITTARDIAVCHHENWDGTGYPNGLAGVQIPLLARICSVADVFDALISTRPYKEAWPVPKAVDWINAQRGLKFDPEVVAAFNEALPDILRIGNLYRDEVIDPKQVRELPEVPSHEERWLQWDPSLSVHIAVIDDHHRYLFDLANDLMSVVVNHLGSLELGRVLKALSEYAAIHFSAEEKMMAAHRFPRLALQRQEHQAFLARLEAFSLEIHENPLVAQYELLAFLRHWLVEHIGQEDVQLSSLT